jgi:hypothetical protein
MPVRDQVNDMIDFEARLQALKIRRQGPRERATLDSGKGAIAEEAILNGVDVRKVEDFERLQEPAAIRYCIGAMKSIDPGSTQRAIDEGRLVVEGLMRAFSHRGMDVSKFVQGAFALDTHVREDSHIEVVVALMGLEGSGRQVQDDRLLAGAREFRAGLEALLKDSAWGSGVDCRGCFSISVEGGNLKRQVWVTPAIFNELPESDAVNDGTMYLYEKGCDALLANNALRYIRLINERDRVYFGNLKRVIRLVGNLIADMEPCRRMEVSCLIEQDVASIAYRMNHKLDMFPGNIVGLIEQVRIHLQMLCDCDKSRNRVLLLDSGKQLFDCDAKVRALEVLHAEFCDLANAVHQVLSPSSGIHQPAVILNKHVG